MIEPDFNPGVQIQSLMIQRYMLPGSALRSHTLAFPGVLHSPRLPNKLQTRARCMSSLLLASQAKGAK